MQHAPKETYTFGDSDRAAERLYGLAATFDPHTLAFAETAAPRGLELVIDLGAGPGFLTRSLHRALAPTRTVGLEASERFVAFGTRELPEGVELLQHDVTKPLPLAGELLVSRFLLTHLGDPAGALRTWNDSARPGATLLLEELARMSSELPLLERYYELVALVQSAQGQDMNIGQRLGALAEAGGFEVVSHAVAPLALPVQAITRLHALNLPTLRAQPAVLARYRPDELDAMQAELERLSREGEGFVRVDMARCHCKRR